jgi:hypothetical protein
MTRMNYIRSCALEGAPIDGTIGQSICPFPRELPMTSSSVTASGVTASTPNVANQPPSSARPRQEKEVSADCGPMSQQDNSNAHGRDMHPQELVQLVGCHESDAEAARRLARDRK